jgi:hypothetical protein
VFSFLGHGKYLYNFECGIFAAKKINKSFCRGSRGAVFSKRVPLAAGGINIE